jgi:hypothetical protein
LVSKGLNVVLPEPSGGSAAADSATDDSAE